MTQPSLTIERRMTFDTPRNRPRPRSATTGNAPPVTGRVPRVARLLALAHRIEALVRSGEVPSYAAVAAVGGVTRGRVAQIVRLVELCPAIQTAILGMSPVRSGDDPISEHDLRPIAAEIDWKRQRRRWCELQANCQCRLTE